MGGLSRRMFFALGTTILVARPSLAGADAAGGPSRAPLTSDPFTLGVASGDPDDTSVILWTRLTGMGLPSTVEVRWEVAANERFTGAVTDGVVTATAEQGHAVHVTATVDGPVYYRFTAGGFTSPPGRAAPAPSTAGELRVATANCQHFETGFYAAHRDIAEWRPDLVAFLGDFIYEGAANVVGGLVVRAHEGPEPVDIAGYRARYATYLADPDLQAARAACPWLVIWDDHEVENNYAGLTPQDPLDAAIFADRRAAAYQAWWEHQPVRLPAPTAGEPFPISRTIRWGELAELIALDGRQFRSPNACPGIPPLSLDPPCPAAADTARTMLGEEQEAWLGETLTASTATWPALVQQTVLSDLVFHGSILNYDQWDGYDPARQRLLDQATVTDRLVVLTGDIHLAGVGVLPGVGVEFVTASISSLGNVPPEVQPILDAFPTVRASELAHRGYTRHTVTPTQWHAEFRIVTDVTDPASPVETWQTFTVDATTRDDVTPGALPPGG